MEVLHRQQIIHAGIEPTLCRTGLTFWAMPVATGVVGDLDLTTILAAQHMATELCSPAAFDGRHHLELVQADMTRVSATPRRPVVAEDVRDFYS